MDAAKKVLVPELIGKSSNSLREAFGQAITEAGAHFSNLVVLDGDVAGGTGAHHFRKAYPKRFYQCGIAEQNMMCVAAGMAAVDLLPVVTSFAVFCLRAVEQARLSIGFSEKNVKIVASHPGLDVGPDGGSAQALEDLAAFRAIPGMVVISPADAYETALATRAMLEYKGPVYMRTGRSPAPDLFQAPYSFEIGKGRIIREGTDLTLVACGVEVARSLEAAALLEAEGISARVVNLSTIKPVDVDLMVRCAKETGAIVTAEDHNIYGGLGSAVAECLVQHHPCPIEFVGVKDVFGESGDPAALAEKYELTAPFIAKAAHRVLKRKKGR